MGNYYGGTLKFFIRRDITKEDFIDLKMMADRCAQKELYSKKLSAQTVELGMCGAFLFM